MPGTRSRSTSKKPDTSFIPCTLRTLPAEHLVAAAEHAVSVNPVNRPRLTAAPGLADGPVAEALQTIVDHPLAIAVLTTKYWGPKGVHLSVTFVEKTAPELAKKIVAYANRWGRTANVEFKLIDASNWHDGDVRISRGRGGYWSYLGTDIRSIPRNQQTMNLQGFSLSTPESEYDRVVCHETGHCLDGDTLIDCPRDIEQHPLGIPIRELVGQTPWVYAWKDGRLVIRKASRVWLSKVNVPTVRVLLRTGRGYRGKAFLPPLELVGTPDHPVLLSDGKTWKKLGDLQPGDRLCSLYRSKNGPRSRIRWTGHPERIREHVFVAEQVYGPRPEGHDCHHKNERKMDQSVENLEWKLEHDHHSDHGRGRTVSEHARQRTRQVWTGRKHTAEARAKISAAHKGKTLSDETKAKMSAATKGKPQSPELVAKRAAGIRRFYANGGRSGMFGKVTPEEGRVKRSASMKATLARKKAAIVNHVVVSVEQVGTRDVYDMTVPDADSFVANGVVVHNSMGAPHEHMRPALVALLDSSKTIAYFERTQGWSAQEIRAQVLTPLSEASLMGTPADQDSIMAYQLPGSITKNGKPIRGGTRINDTDAAFMAKIYPKLPGNVLLQPLEGTGGRFRYVIESDAEINITPATIGADEVPAR